MASITIRNAPDELHRALQGKAATQESQVKLGSRLGAIGREAGLTAEDCDSFGRLRDKTPVEPMPFE